MFPRVTHPSATPVLLRAFDLHVLSLPPAFVLSQDQTLMLRIQSLAKITFEIDENFTPVLQSLSLRKDPKTSVTSLDKRDRQSLFQGQDLNPVRGPRRPRFSFFYLQLSNNRRSTPSQSLKNQQTTPNRSPAQFTQLLKETLERVRRPPEAPPLSFDERRYRPNILNRQLT